jgi:hypothetical protein
MMMKYQTSLFGPPVPITPVQKHRVKKVLTYSGISMFQTCRRKHKLRHEDYLVPIEKPHALRFGSVAHNWLEVWHGTGDIDAAQTVIDRAYINRLSESDEKRDWHYQTAMLRAYVAEYCDEDFEVVVLEKEFSGPLVNPATGRKSRSFIIRGKVDGIVRRGDQHLLLEHKTAATISGDYLERLAMDLQILLYSYYVRETLDCPVTEVLYNVLVKPRLAQAEGETEQEYEVRKAGLAAKSKSGKSSAKRRMPESDEDFQGRLAAWFAAEPRFTRQQLLLDFDSIANVRQMLWDISKELLDARRTGRWHQNSRSCFGFGRCMYWPICSAMGNDEMVIENLFTRAAPHSELSPDEESGPAF